MLVSIAYAVTLWCGAAYFEAMHLNQRLQPLIWKPASTADHGGELSQKVETLLMLHETLGPRGLELSSSAQARQCWTVLLLVPEHLQKTDGKNCTQNSTSRQCSHYFQELLTASLRTSNFLIKRRIMEIQIKFEMHGYIH